MRKLMNLMESQMIQEKVVGNSVEDIKAWASDEAMMRVSLHHKGWSNDNGEFRMYFEADNKYIEFTSEQELSKWWLSRIDKAHEKTNYVDQLPALIDYLDSVKLVFDVTFTDLA